MLGPPGGDAELLLALDGLLELGELLELLELDELLELLELDELDELDELEELDELDELEELLLELGGVLLGTCGVVGLLALGQPASNRQAQASASGAVNPATALLLSLLEFILLGHVFRNHWLAHRQRGAEPGLPQFAHDAIYQTAAQLVLIHPLQVSYLALGVHCECQLQ